MDTVRYHHILTLLLLFLLSHYSADVMAAGDGCPRDCCSTAADGTIPFYSCLFHMGGKYRLYSPQQYRQYNYIFLAACLVMGGLVIIYFYHL